MRLSAAAFVLALRLVAAAPRHESHDGNMPGRVSSGSHFDNEIAPQNIEAHGINKAMIQVEITTTPQSKLYAPEISTTEEKIPGWLFLDGRLLQGRIHGNTFWNVKGELDEEFPNGEFLFDPLVFTLNHPTDFEGTFTGTVGRGQVTLKWERSGATIAGRSPIGDFNVKGKSHVDWSP